MNRLENRIPPPLVAAAFALAMGAVARWLPAASATFPGQAWGAAVLVAAGLGVIAVSVLQFARARTTVNPLDPAAASALVTEGIFQLTRNPMYLGMALILAGWGCWLGNGAGALLVAGFVASITRLQVIPEERALRAHFGERFDAYAAQVRRWI